MNLLRSLFLLAGAFAVLFLVTCNKDHANRTSDRQGQHENAQPDTTEATVEVVQMEGPAAEIGVINGMSGTALPSFEDANFTTASYQAPGFSWKTGAGEVESLEDYRGDVVMLNFWGTWCPPCRRELPDIVKLRDEFSSKGFEVLGIALERPVAGESVEEHLAVFAEANDLRYPMLVGNAELVQHYGSSPYVPTTFIVDRDGNVVNMLVGGMSEAQFRAAIEKVL
ncbi:MAG: TlpA family protein disulfide reductase [Chlorobi bacterium]|nr:TlpA family protein disulfide reductase [Chlorobiota bacterium]